MKIKCKNQNYNNNDNTLQYYLALKAEDQTEILHWL